MKTQYTLLLEQIKELKQENARMEAALEAISAVIDDDGQWFFSSNFAEIYNIMAEWQEKP